VTNIAFEAFSCYEFEGGRGWLVSDMSIECGTPAHDQAKMLAYFAIVVYPVGLFGLNGALLFGARKAIATEQQTPLYQATLFLHREYEKVCAEI
jgi:hypothetical protein